MWRRFENCSNLFGEFHVKYVKISTPNCTVLSLGLLVVQFVPEKVWDSATCTWVLLLAKLLT
jgi:hypothetical protein